MAIVGLPANITSANTAGVCGKVISWMHTTATQICCAGGNYCTNCGSCFRIATFPIGT
jgi:hypothetical protein